MHPPAEPLLDASDPPLLDPLEALLAPPVELLADPLLDPLDPPVLDPLEAPVDPPRELLFDPLPEPPLEPALSAEASALAATIDCPPQPHNASPAKAIPQTTLTPPAIR